MAEVEAFSVIKFLQDQKAEKEAKQAQSKAK